MKYGDDTVMAASERPKRRHARPHELDSDEDEDGGNDDEGKEEDTTLEEEIIPDKVETLVPDNNAPQMLVKRDFALKRQ